MALATEVVCFQNPCLSQDGKCDKQDEEAPLERGASKSSPQCIFKRATASNCPNEPFALCMLYPCSAAEGQIAMASGCRRPH